MGGVEAVGVRFDIAAASFAGKIMDSMLPPEVENLHRIAHSVEALKNALLYEFSAGRDVDASGTTLMSQCERYFAAVLQFEADLIHYQGAQQQEGEKPRRQEVAPHA